LLSLLLSELLISRILVLHACCCVRIKQMLVLAR
jgi:hypothetical protein